MPEFPHTIPILKTTAQFDATNNGTLTDVTDLVSPTLVVARYYAFEVVLFIDANVTAGSKYAIHGSGTFTSIKYQIMLFDNNTNAITINARQTAEDGASGQAGTTAGICIIKGMCLVNTAGTLSVQFAQNTGTPATTSSVLTNSYFKVEQIT